LPLGILLLLAAGDDYVNNKALVLHVKQLCMQNDHFQFFSDIWSKLLVIKVDNKKPVFQKGNFLKSVQFCLKNTWKQVCSIKNDFCLISKYLLCRHGYYLHIVLVQQYYRKNISGLCIWKIIRFAIYIHMYVCIRFVFR
jgi:hypothetical protein